MNTKKIFLLHLIIKPTELMKTPNLTIKALIKRCKVSIPTLKRSEKAKIHLLI